jgi:hypothetical protein
LALLVSIPFPRALPIRMSCGEIRNQTKLM